jgi:hypothetical protein
MSDDITFEDNVAISRELETIARMIDKRLRRATGGKAVPFSLYTWGGHRSLYVSNTARDDAKIAMKETLSRWGEDHGPIHKTAN